MSATKAIFTSMLDRMGSDVVYHRESGGSPCPCRTPEGFRDPSWHRANPSEPVCNEQGFLSVVIMEIKIKATIQPPRMRGNRGAERVDVLLGQVRSGDKIGVFPTEWNGVTLTFKDWSDAGEDFIRFDGDRYMVVEADKLGDTDGDPNHHWEVGLRLIKNERP